MGIDWMNKTGDTVFSSLDGVWNARNDSMLSENPVRYGFIIPSGTNAQGFAFIAFPETLTSSARIVLKPYVNEEPEQAPVLLASEQVKFVLAFYGFSKSDLARIIGITRPALYAWLDGKSEPGVENIKMLLPLVRIASGIDSRPLRPLFHGYVERILDGNTRSLLDMLTGEALDWQAIARLTHQIFGLSRERDMRIEACRPIDENAMKRSKSASDDNLYDNLMAIGTLG
jgi:transcriptional regulator with XRE-family HTH domain